MQGDQTMSDTENDPQPVDPPVNTGGGGTSGSDSEETGTAEAQAVDPPANTGGGG